MWSLLCPFQCSVLLQTWSLDGSQSWSAPDGARAKGRQWVGVGWMWLRYDKDLWGLFPGKNSAVLGQYLLSIPVSPSGVSGISACHFRNCRSFDELWIFWVGLATIKYGRAAESETHKTPSTLQACSIFWFFSNPFWEFCFSTPAFSSTILLHRFVQVFDTLKIPVHCFGTEILWKRWFAWAFRKHFSFSYAIFTWIWTYKTHDLTDHQLIVGSFLPAIASMGRTTHAPELVLDRPGFFCDVSQLKRSRSWVKMF